MVAYRPCQIDICIGLDSLYLNLIFYFIICSFIRLLFIDSTNAIFMITPIRFERNNGIWLK